MNADPTGPAPSRGLVLALIAIGGGAGTLLRFAISQLFSADQHGWPTATFTANLLGCAAMGVFLGWLSATGRIHQRMTPFVTAGFLGGMTTFSAFAHESVELAQAGHPNVAIGYVVASVAFGCLLVRIGWIVGRRAVEART